MPATTPATIEPIHSFRIVFKSREQFYKLVTELNKRAGHGSNNWTIKGSVLRKLNPRYKAPVETTLLVYNTRFTSEEFLSLFLVLDLQTW